MTALTDTTRQSRGLLDVGDDEKTAALKLADQLFAAYQADPSQVNYCNWQDALNKYHEIRDLYDEGRKLKNHSVLPRTQ